MCGNPDNGQKIAFGFKGPQRSHLLPAKTRSIKKEVFDMSPVLQPYVKEEAWSGDTQKGAIAKKWKVSVQTLQQISF